MTRTKTARRGLRAGSGLLLKCGLAVALIAGVVLIPAQVARAQSTTTFNVTQTSAATVPTGMAQTFNISISCNSVTEPSCDGLQMTWPTGGLTWTQLSTSPNIASLTNMD